MRNGQTRCDLSVRLIIISLGKFNGCVIMLVFDVAVQKFSSEHNLLNKTLAQAAIRVSDDSPQLLYLQIRINLWSYIPGMKGTSQFYRKDHTITSYLQLWYLPSDYEFEAFTWIKGTM